MYHNTRVNYFDIQLPCSRRCWMSVSSTARRRPLHEPPRCLMRCGPGSGCVAGTLHAGAPRPLRPPRFLPGQPAVTRRHCWDRQRQRATPQPTCASHLRFHCRPPHRPPGVGGRRPPRPAWRQRRPQSEVLQARPVLWSLVTASAAARSVATPGQRGLGCRWNCPRARRLVAAAVTWPGLAPMRPRRAASTRPPRRSPPAWEGREGGRVGGGGRGQVVCGRRRAPARVPRARRSNLAARRGRLLPRGGGDHGEVMGRSARD
jgi:hypothetical protein